MFEIADQIIGIRAAFRNGESYKNIEPVGFRKEYKHEYSFINGKHVSGEDALISECRELGINSFMLWKEGMREGMLCLWNDGHKTLFVPSYPYRESRVIWHEKEFESDDSYMGEDNTAEFKRILSELISLARTIKQDSWADEYFCKALDYLNGKNTDESSFSWLPASLDNRNLYMACLKAHVFGGMGSWNDSTEAAADSMGLGDEHTRLTLDLTRAIRIATLFVVNNS